MKILRFSLAVVIILVVFGGSMLRSAGFLIHDIYWFQESLGGDRITHIIMGSLTVIALRLLIPRRSLDRIFLYAGLVLILEESSQIFQTTREFSFLDLAMSLLGICVGALAVLIIKEARSLPFWNSVKLLCDRTQSRSRIE